MAYLQILADEIIYQMPNVSWEYLKVYISPQMNKKNNLGVKDESIYEKYKEQIDVFKIGCHVGLDESKIKNLTDPPWLDVEKLKRGQEFAKEYYFSVCYSNIISLFLLFAHDRSLRGLIYTRKSDDIESAYKRYMSTIHRVKSWFEDDLTDPSSQARKHINTVNKYHLNIYSKLNSISDDQFTEQSELINGKLKGNNNVRERVKKVLDINRIEIDKDFFEDLDHCIHVSQSHMSSTLFGFMGLVVLYPEKFGIYDEEGVDGYIHLWQYIGYLLGVEDKFNLCSGSTQQVKTKCAMLLECVLKPTLLEANSSWEHMSVCVYEGINKVFKRLIFDTMLAFLLNCIDLKFDYFYDSMKLKSKLNYYIVKFTFTFLMFKKGIRCALNNGLERMLEEEKHFS